MKNIAEIMMFWVFDLALCLTADVVNSSLLTAEDLSVPDISSYA